MTTSGTTPLFVRLPAEAAVRLDRAAQVAGAAKKDIVAGLVARYVDPDSEAGRAALSELRGARPARRSSARRAVAIGEERELALGRVELPPAEPRQSVLTVPEASALLRVDESVVEQLAAEGQLPGRQLGGEWRFSRQALLDWLAGGAH